MTLEDGEAAPATGTRRRGFFRRWIRRLFALGVLVVALPVVMVPLYTVVPPVSTLMVFDTLARGGVSRTYVPIEEISPHLVRAVLMSEDGRFCEHRGVDWDALYEVLESADAEGPTRGASTIPMQTAKNLFLWNGRSYVRKAMEIPLALYMDLVWSKRRMMEIYLNIAEWGPGVYGAEAGAQAHFGKPAAALTAREAALMAVTLPNPHARNPGSPSRRLAGLARIIEARAAKSGGYVGCVLG
jgi:monofunctional glycosyltransferase